MPTPTPTPTGEQGNFRLLVSDEVNAIKDFQHLHVTISSIGVHQAGESGKWHEFDLDPEADLDGDNVAGIDLRPLEGENALEIWSGNLTAGEYNKVFIYVDKVTGVLEGGGTAEVKLPSNKLQISKPFTIGDSVVSFVYDITVVNAGKSGKYVLKPQIAQSGPDKLFNDVTPKGKPEKPGKPEGKGKPEDKGKPGGKGKPGEDEAEELEFEGTIETIIDATTWTMTIEGKIWTVDVSEAAIEGEPAVELEAKVKGTVVDDDTIVASEVKIVESEDITAPVISVSGVTNGQQYTGSVTPIISVSDDTDEEPSVVATLNGNPFVSGTVIDEVGKYELGITATDASGNEAEVAITFEIVEGG
jgi:CYTH domain-containing protein